jgi:hypothetical protein
MLEENNNMMPRNGGARTLPWVILAVVLLVFVVAGVLFRDRLFPSQTTETTQEEGTSSGYQAVFLSNGQVYFGKLSGTTASYATLNDIYYLQVTTPPATDASQLNQQQAQQQQQLSLVKLGQELHGPVDEMKINREQILFYEDIKEDGRVMQAIREYQKNPPAANTNTNTQAPATQQTVPANSGQTPAPNQ